MMFKNLLCAVVFLPLLAAAAVPAVVIPAAPVKNGSRTGLQELRTYLQKICGKAPAVIREGGKIPADVPVIYYGNTAFAAARKVDLKKMGDEEWLIRSVGKDLIIAGGEPRGNLYGVYHFLEDVLGVRWLSPHVEYVPRTLKKWGKVDLKGKPAFAHRSIYLVPGTEGGLFLVRNRMSSSASQYGGRMPYSHFSGRESQGSGHTLYTALGTADYIKDLYKKHPEYFPLIKGKRTLDQTRANGGSQSQLCLTHPEVRRLWVEAMRKHIQYDRDIAKRRSVQTPMFYAVDQNDCFDGFCECPKCDAIVKKENKSGLLLDFTNYVATALKKDAPDAIFLMMALHSTEKAPNTMKAAPNVGIRLCDTTSNMLKPWTDPVNNKQRKNLEDWAKISKFIYIWDYSINYGAISCVNFPFPSMRTYPEDLRKLHKENGYGIFFEHENIISADLRDLKVYLEVKFAENPYLDYDKVLKDFTDHYYGEKAAVYIRQYLAALEDAAKKGNARITWYPVLSAFSYINAECMISFNRILDQAYAAAETPAQKERVEYTRLSLDKLYLFRVRAMKKGYAISGKDVKLLPDEKVVRARFERVWKREWARQSEYIRKHPYFRGEYKKHFQEVLKAAAQMRELPHPAQFKSVPKDALYLFSTATANVYIGYLKKVKDPESVTGEALRGQGKDIAITL
ncbi:MAG: DUF4838 domain-containing protein [Lentisphaeria bacterium]|nr:DUF4838 domain-containing protein [Lentisphaeria bacterium]